MSDLTKIRRKIESIKTTKKITHAIRLVSRSSYSRLEKEKSALEKYKKTILQILSQLSNEAPSWKNKFLFPNDLLDNTPLIIIISSNKGLCGSFNSNLNRYVKKNLFFEKHQKPSFVTIGKTSQKIITENNLGKKLHHYNELTNENLVTMASEIIKIITLSEKPFSSVSFFSNKLKNFFVQKPKKTTLIPSDFESLSPQTKKGFSPIWEQPKKDILNHMASKYLRSSVIETLFQSLLSEHAARFLSMDNSANNASKYIDTLTIQYNKIRQTLITREVSELAANM